MIKKEWDSSDLYAACARTDPVLRESAYKKLWEYLFRVVLNYVFDQPDAEAVAQDCAQEALIRIHDHFQECHSPDSFLAWARKIASHLAIDELRRNRRLISFEDMQEGSEEAGHLSREEATPAEISEANIQFSNLRTLLEHAPMSDRSRRVVIGRYLDELPDERLAQIESRLAEQTVLPSHIQVTRTKDIARLRDFQPLHVLLSRAVDEVGGKPGVPNSV